LRETAKNEEEVMDIINQAYFDLIEEETYPWLLKKFHQIDKKYLFPLFKRETIVSQNHT